MFNIFVLLAAVSHFYLARSNYYVAVEASKNWFDAQEACQNGVWVRASGGHLATWNSFDEYRLKVVQARHLIGNSASWVGLSDFTEDQWQFVDNSPSGNQKDNLAWSSGQPNNWGGNQDCGYIWDRTMSKGNPTVKGLDDSACSATMNYICEFEQVDYALGKEDVISGPILDSFPADGGDKNNNYFIFEFSSNKDMVVLASIMLNVVLLAAVCGLITKRTCGAESGRPYSKVNMYSTDTEDEKLNV